MKKTFIAFVLLLCAFGAQAQKLELGLHGGIGYDALPLRIRDSVIPAGATSTYVPAVSFRTVTNVRRFQLGLGMDIQKLEVKKGDTKYVFANPAVNLYLTGTWEYELWGGTEYIGLNVGMLFARSANYTKYADNNKIVPEVVYLEPGRGLSVGIVGGRVFKVSERINIFTQATIFYSSYPVEYTYVKNYTTYKGEDRYHLMYGNLLVGVHLKLFTDPFRQWIPYNRVR